MKRLTKEQLAVRDEDIDWFIAQNLKYAQHQNVWHDYSPTSKWEDAGPLIEEYQIDIRFFNKELNSKLEHSWMGGLQVINPKTNLLTYYTAFGETPLIAAMKALAASLNK